MITAPASKFTMIAKTDVGIWNWIHYCCTLASMVECGKLRVMNCAWQDCLQISGKLSCAH